MHKSVAYEISRLFFIGVLVVVLLLGCSVQIATAEEGYQLVGNWGGSPDGAFSAPTWVAIDSAGNVYVTDHKNQRIQKFTSSGAFITMWGSYGFGKLDAPNGQFYYPGGIAVDREGYVYVADTWNDRVQKFTSTGSFVTKWGGSGSEAGQLDMPAAIAVDGAGYVYVADWKNNRVQKFTSTGTFVAKWGVIGSENGQFNEPRGIAVDSEGYVYVVETGNNRVQKFTSTGTFLTKWGISGSGDGQFNYPQGIGVDGTGSVYVADTSNNRIQKFTSTGTFLAKWGTYGSGDGRFNDPWDIAVDGAGNVYVADSLNNLIQKFAPISPISTTSTFRFTPSPLTIKRGSTNTTTLYIDGLKNGISGFNVSLSLSLTDPTIGEIVGVSLPGWTMQVNAPRRYSMVVSYRYGRHQRTRGFKRTDRDNHNPGGPERSDCSLHHSSESRR